MKQKEGLFFLFCVDERYYVRVCVCLNFRVFLSVRSSSVDLAQLSLPLPLTPFLILTQPELVYVRSTPYYSRKNVTHNLFTDTVAPSSLR